MRFLFRSKRCRCCLSTQKWVVSPAALRGFSVAMAKKRLPSTSSSTIQLPPVGTMSTMVPRPAAQRAASALGGEEGVFTPAQLLNAVKAMDPSRNKGAFARGDALLQDLAEPAKTVLSQSVPDSGTAGRLLASLIMGGAPVAAMVNPVAGAALLPAAAYAPGVQRGVAALLASRQGSVLSGTAEGMRALTPAMSALLAGPVAGAQ